MFDKIGSFMIKLAHFLTKLDHVFLDANYAQYEAVLMLRSRAKLPRNTRRPRSDAFFVAMTVSGPDCSNPAPVPVVTTGRTASPASRSSWNAL